MPPTITLVPHTHWDREWYEPFDVFLDRLVVMMDTLLDLAERGFPHFHLDGQTAMVDDYLAVRPEREADVRRLAAQGRLSIGPWVAQMDEFLTSGESHIRNLEMGLDRAREISQATLIGYLPDQFGHIGQMPQILRQAGIEHAVVWRGVPGTIGTTAFRWVAPDGSSVRTEYLAFGYSLGHDLHRFEDPGALAGSIRDKLARIEPYLAGDRMLITVGSDHAGPDASLPERLAAAQELLPEVKVRIGSLDEHLDGAAEPDLPVWHGELRSSARAHLLPNVYSARVHQKRERGRSEALIERYAEPLAALVPGFGWPAERLDRAWTLLLWNGAHDSVCGCSHDQVARDVDARHGEVRALGEAIVDAALRRLGESVRARGVLRFNPSPFEREGVPPLGWRVDEPEAEPRGVPVAIELRDGWVDAADASFTLRDEPDVGDLYNFCPAEDGRTAAGPSDLASSDGTVTASWDGLLVRVRVVRREDDPFVRLEGTIHNDRPDHRVRLHVRLPQRAVGSLAGSPFELVERGLVSEGSELEPGSRTWPARGVVLAGGVAAYHEGVFEYEVTSDELVITLLRAVGTISRHSIATRPWPAGPEVATPDAQMLGTTAFSFGLRLGASPGDLMRDWERFALAIRGAPASGGGSLPGTGTLLEIGGDAVLSSVRRTDDQVAVRLWNPWRDRAVFARVAGRAIELAPAEIATVLATG
jgi:alpha-mannosidase